MNGSKHGVDPFAVLRVQAVGLELVGQRAQGFQGFVNEVLEHVAIGNHPSTHRTSLPRRRVLGARWMFST